MVQEHRHLDLLAGECIEHFRQHDLLVVQELHALVVLEAVFQVRADQRQHADARRAGKNLIRANIEGVIELALHPRPVERRTDGARAGMVDRKERQRVDQRHGHLRLAQADGLVAHQVEGLHRVLQLELALAEDAAAGRQFAEVDADHVPALGFQLVDECLAAHESAVLRDRAAAGKHEAVHLAGDHEDEIGLSPTDEEPGKVGRVVVR